MPSKDRDAVRAYQRRYYAAHRQTLRKRARLRQRVVRRTQTLWHLLPEPLRFCRVMAQRAAHQCGWPVEPDLLEDAAQDIAEALVQGPVPSTLREPVCYAATMAIRVALHTLRKQHQQHQGDDSTEHFAEPDEETLCGT